MPQEDSMHTLKEPMPLRSLVPSLPAQSFTEIRTLLDTLRGISPGVQIDIVDGVFAPYVSWPFTEPDVIHAFTQLGEYCNDFEIEIDCMCMHPEVYLDLFVALGVKRVVIHAGSTDDYEGCITHAHTHGYRIGLGIKNDTPTEIRDEYIPLFDFVQVMGIAHIGVQGQPFDERTLDTVSEIRKKYPHLEIAVDGAVNAETMPALFDVGVDRFAPGSAIAKSNDPRTAYKQLTQMVGL